MMTLIGLIFFLFMCMWMGKTWDACIDIRKIAKTLEEIKEHRKIAETLEEIKEQINSNKNE